MIVTGASHTGKSTVIQALLPALEPPVAVLSVDSVLSGTLVKPQGDPWLEIPLAYRLIDPQIDLLLGEGWLVIVESTFTFVPATGEPEFHREAIARMTATADRREAPWTIVQAHASDDVVIERARSSGRLPLRIVAATLSLHSSAEMPAGVVRIDSTDTEPDNLAQTLLARLPSARSA